MSARLRLACTALLLVAATACSKPGVNAGEQGGRAWIMFSVMLLIMIAALWFILGRED